MIDKNFNFTSVTKLFRKNMSTILGHRVMLKRKLLVSSGKLIEVAGGEYSGFTIDNELLAFKAP
jgi:hypothetical protein